MDGMMVLKLVFEEENGETWNGLVCLRMETRGGLLWTR